MIERPRSQLLACVTADGQACSLVDHARHLATALGSSWAVLSLDDAVAADPARAVSDPGRNLLGNGRVKGRANGRANERADRQANELANELANGQANEQAQDKALTAGRELQNALQAAALAGARISSVQLPSGRTRRAALVASVAACARAQDATTVLVGWPCCATAGWSAAWSARVDSPGQLTQQLQRVLPGVTVHLIDDGKAAPAADLSAGTAWWRGTATALAVLALCTLLSALLEPYLEPANLIMVYLAGVVYVALRTSRPVALLTVIGSVFLYDLLFIAPSGPLKPSEPHYVLVSVVMLLVGFIVSHLAARSRQQAAMAELRAQRAQALNHLALELVKARSPASIGTALAFAVHRTLQASAQLLPVDAQGQLDCTDDTFAPQARLARAALQQRCDTGAGTAIEPRPALPLLAAAGRRRPAWRGGGGPAFASA